MIATKSALEPQSNEPLPNSKRVYIPGKLHPEVRVPLREIHLSDTRSFDGRVEVNEPERVYDCCGPWGDENFKGNVEEGLPPLRRAWVLARGDVADSNALPAAAGFSLPRSAVRKPLRAKPGRAVTQLYYARQGMITPEMEFIAIRENLGRERRHAHNGNGQNGTRRDLGGEPFG